MDVFLPRCTIGNILFSTVKIIPSNLHICQCIAMLGLSLSLHRIILKRHETLTWQTYIEFNLFLFQLISEICFYIQLSTAIKEGDYQYKRENIC